MPTSSHFELLERLSEKYAALFTEDLGVTVLSDTLLAVLMQLSPVSSTTQPPGE